MSEDSVNERAKLQHVIQQRNEQVLALVAEANEQVLARIAEARRLYASCVQLFGWPPDFPADVELAMLQGAYFCLRCGRDECEGDCSSGDRG